MGCPTCGKPWDNMDPCPNLLHAHHQTVEGHHQLNIANDETELPWLPHVTARRVCPTCDGRGTVEA